MTSSSATVLRCLVALMGRGEFWLLVTIMYVLPQGGLLAVALVIGIDLLIGYLSELVGKKWD